MTEMRPVIVSAPLPAGKDGVSLGQIRTVWSTEDIAASSRDFAMKAMMLQMVVLIIAVAMLLFAMRRFVGRPLAEVNQPDWRRCRQAISTATSPMPRRATRLVLSPARCPHFCEASRAKAGIGSRDGRQRDAAWMPSGRPT
jgi:methyl-accepting chemotaxis protein